MTIAINRSASVKPEGKPTTKENQMLHDTNADQRSVALSATEDVFGHHLSCFQKGDLSGLMEDYDSQAKFFTPNGILRGSTAIREFFSTLLEEFGKPGLSFERLREDIEGDTVYLCLESRHRRQPLRNSPLTPSSCRTERS
jgi:ketosteroid isomerase-like protein